MLGAGEEGSTLDGVSKVKSRSPSHSEMVMLRARGLCGSLGKNSRSATSLDGKCQGARQPRECRTMAREEQESSPQRRPPYRTPPERACCAARSSPGAACAWKTRLDTRGTSRRGPRVNRGKADQKGGNRLQRSWPRPTEPMIRSVLSGRASRGAARAGSFRCCVERCPSGMEAQKPCTIPHKTMPLEAMSGARRVPGCRRTPLACAGFFCPPWIQLIESFSDAPFQTFLCDEKFNIPDIIIILLLINKVIFLKIILIL